MDSAGLDTAVMHTVRSRLGQRMGARCGLESGGGGIRTLERPVTSNGFRDRFRSRFAGLFLLVRQCVRQPAEFLTLRAGVDVKRAIAGPLCLGSLIYSERRVSGRTARASVGSVKPATARTAIPAIAASVLSARSGSSNAESVSGRTSVDVRSAATAATASPHTSGIAA